MKLLNNLKLRRMLNNAMTQQQLAEVVGCSRQTIISIENLKFIPSIELALKIAQSLNCKVEDIFFFENKNNPIQIERKSE